MASSLFDGLRVIDCGSFIAAPAAATILSDFGADVITRATCAGDPYRQLPSMPGSPASEQNYGWMPTRGKRTLALEFAKVEAPAVLHQLVRGADVFYPARVRE